MAAAKLSPAAEMDLADTWYFINQDSERAADLMLRRLMNEIRKLTEYPGMGARCDEVRKGFRSWPVGSYVIFYRVKVDVVEVIRILDGARSLDKEFGPGDV